MSINASTRSSAQRGRLRHVLKALRRAAFSFGWVLASVFTAMFLSLVACSGCEGDDVAGLTPRLSVEPTMLDFGQLPVGVTGRRALSMTNTGNAPLAFSSIAIGAVSSASLDGDVFRISSEVPSGLQPAASRTIFLDARGAEANLETAVLVLNSDDPASPLLEIALRAEIVPAPSCDDGNQCTKDVFDPNANACTHSFDDGAACTPADRCILEATCSQGVCLGTARDCDDDDPCTREFCRQSTGECVYVPDDSGCDDRNPCTADACESAQCRHEPVTSGTPCDDGDLCTFADACLAGTCRGTGRPNGSSCDDGDSCTKEDICLDGICRGQSIVDEAPEGTVVFRHPLTSFTETAFLHRREVSLGNDGTLFGLDHIDLFDDQGSLEGFAHVIFSLTECGSRPRTDFVYRPPDRHVAVSYVWREMQLAPDNELRVMVAVRHLPSNGFILERTTYVLDPEGRVTLTEIQEPGAEIGRALLPDGSAIYAILTALDEGPTTPATARQNLVVVRQDAEGNVLWRHDRTSGVYAEFLGVAGPRVLFWTNNRFGALDFNTGSTVWTQETAWVSREMALSTELNLGVARTQRQIIGVEVLQGTQVFGFPPNPSPGYVPTTDPIISSDGRVLFVMENRDAVSSTGIVWVELTRDGQVLSETLLPYTFPLDRADTRAPDNYADPNPTVADDGVAYVGYGDRFFAIEPGGRIRWTLIGDEPHSFTGTVPLLRADGVMLISRGDREIIGVRTNGGRMSESGWASFRHDNRRTNYTP